MKNSKHLFSFLLVAAVLGSCTPEVEERLQINGQEYPSSVQAPAEDEGYVKVQADADAFSIVAVDKSSPSADVKSRVWMLKNSYGDVVRTTKDSSAIRLVLATQGVFSLNLTVNDDVEGSITNWIKVEGEVEDINLNSSIDFITPLRAFEVTNRRQFDVLLRASVWLADLEGISIKHNGNEITDFELDELMEQISFSINLKEGENTIAVTGDVEGDQIDLSRTIEYNKDTKSSGSSQVAQSGGGSVGGQTNKSAKVETDERPEQPLSSQLKKEDVPEPVAEVAPDKPVKKAPEVTPPAVKKEVEEEEEDENAPTKTFDIGNKDKSLSAYHQEKVLGIKVVSLSDLDGGCELQFANESFIIDISGVKDIMYIESLKLAQNPEAEGTDVTIKLECLNSGRIGKKDSNEQAVVGYTQNKPMNISLSRLSKMPLLPGNEYRLTIICESNIELGYVDVNNCGGKIDKNDIVKLDYKGSKCPLFSLKLKH